MNLKEIGEALREARIKKRWSCKEAGDFFGVSHSAVSSWERGQYLPKDKESLVREYKLDPEIFGLSQSIREDLDDFATNGEDMHKQYIFLPRYSVEAGAGSGRIIESEQITDYMAFRRDWFSARNMQPNNACLIKALGDSMEPTIPSGALVLVDLSRCNAHTDGIYVFRTDGDLRIKRMQRMMNGNIRVRSDNPEYQEEIVEPDKQDSFEIIGRAVWVGVEI